MRKIIRGVQMDIHCGMEYDINTPAPPRARFALWYNRRVRFFVKRENAEEAIKYLDYDERISAFIEELECEDLVASNG
jgi:hypothetical protein